MRVPSGGGGCCALVALAFVIALVVAAVASAAAIVDPFAWLPSVSELWSHCEDKFATARDECAWANRFPGFWPHMLANLAWAVAAVACAVVVVMAALHVREARTGAVRRLPGARAIPDRPHRVPALGRGALGARRGAGPGRRVAWRLAKERRASEGAVEARPAFALFGLLLEPVEGPHRPAQVVHRRDEDGLAGGGRDGAAELERAVVGEDDVQQLRGRGPRGSRCSCPTVDRTRK